MNLLNLAFSRPSLTLSVLLSVILSANAQQLETTRTSFGAPDLQGTYNIATLTMLERGPQFEGKLVITPEEAANLGTTDESFLNALTDQLEAGGTDVGGYNTFWMDPGNRLAVINGEIRTSILVQPENGRLPWAQGAQAGIFGANRNGLGQYDGPEARPMGERCLVGFGSSGGPPMLPVLYNNHSQIVQTPDYVVILAEMNHDARIIRMRDTQHEELPKWLGDSIGHYEGDTLVVETTNFHPTQSLRVEYRHMIYVSPTAKVTERFTRLDEQTLLYQFTVDDPAVYSSPWTGELPMNAVEDKVYEYACHEGNYALPGILAGARQQERDARE